MFAPISWVSYTRVIDGTAYAKEVGYVLAINWWPPLIVTLPLIVFLAMRSIQNLRRSVEHMVDCRMFALKDWSGPAADVDDVIVRLWGTAFVIGAVIFVLVFVVVVADWWCVVHVPFAAGNVIADLSGALESAACKARQAHENDWSIAALLPSRVDNPALFLDTPRPGTAMNYAFSAFVYLLLAVEAGILLAYYGFILAFALTVYRLSEESEDVIVVPHLDSGDPRHRVGFEWLELVFRPCVLATFVAFGTAFLMRIQNAYLRVPEAGDVFAFLTGNYVPRGGDDEVSTVMGNAFESVGGFIALLGIDEQFGDPQFVLGLAVVLIVLTLLALTLSYVLQSAVRRARDRVRQGLVREATRAKVEAYYGLSREEIEERLGEIQTWPLSWPELREARNFFFAGILCFVFYRVAIVWVLVFAWRLMKREGEDG